MSNAASSAKWARARERNRARIAALNASAPIMCLPAEIRAAIFGHLSIIQQFKVNYYPELRWVFNTSDEWNIGRVEDSNFPAIMLLYEEAQLFDKVAAKVALLRIQYINASNKRPSTLDILGRCHPLVYYNIYSDDEYCEREYEPLLTEVICNTPSIQSDMYDYIIVIKTCFILIEKKRASYLKRWPEDDYCIWDITSGKYCITVQIDIEELWVGDGWGLYYELIRKMGYLLDICNSEPWLDQLIAIYKKYFSPDFNGVKVAIVKTVTSNHGKYKTRGVVCPRYEAYLAEIKQLSIQ